MVDQIASDLRSALLNDLFRQHIYLEALSGGCLYFAL